MINLLSWEYIGNLTSKFPQLLSVELTLLNDETYRLDTIVVRKKRNKITIDQSWIGLNNLEQLSKAVDTSLPVVINITGKGLLIKGGIKSEADTETIFESSLPGIQPSQFVYQRLELYDKSMVALLRKDKMEAIVKEFSDKGLIIVDVQLAFCSLANLSHIFPASQQQINLVNWYLEMKEGMVSSFKEQIQLDNLKSIVLDKEEVPAQQMISFVSALNYYLGITEEAKNIQEAKNNRLDASLKRFYTYFVGISLGTLLTVLGINSILYMKLNEKSEQQRIELAANEKKIKALKIDQDNSIVKKKFLTDNPILQPSKVSMYGDQIAATVPNHIRLKGLTIFPSIKSDKKSSQKYKFDLQTILVKGITDRSIYLNEWLHDLEGLHWVKEVMILPYSENQLGEGQFEIKIIINPE